MTEDCPRLIEYAFPLKQASLDSVHEKNVRHGHISTLHIWPARRPLAAGLGEHPGFDLLSKRPGGEEPDIEVKGRAGVGDMETPDNKWARACNLPDRYRLYVVFDCASPHSRLVRVEDPFLKPLMRPKGGVIVDEGDIFEAAEAD